MRALAGKYAPLIGTAAAGLIGAGGSILGNLNDKEQGEGPARIATEALMAGINAAPAGFAIGLGPGIKQNIKQRIPQNIPESLKKEMMSGVNKGINTAAAINLATMPISAGLGGLLGGGISNIANAIGVSGYQPGVVINPESYGSSNLNYPQKSYTAR